MSRLQILTHCVFADAYSPRIRLEPERPVYIVGDSLSVRCDTDSPISISSYHFFKDAKLVTNTSSTNRLLIQSLSIMDAGDYLCASYTAEGNISQSHLVKINVFAIPPAPKLVVEPLRNVFLVNQSVVIRCLVLDGQSAKSIQLYQNGAILFEADNFGVLSLNNTQKRHSGNYSCKYMTDISGRVVESHPSNQAMLAVIDLPPTPILRYAKSLRIQSNEIEIVCEVPNPSIPSLINGFCLYRNGGEVLCQQSNRIVMNYDLEFDGCYFCRSVVNLLGEEVLSRKSNEVFLTLIESNVRSCTASEYGLSRQGIKLYGSVLVGKLIVLISIMLIFGVHLLATRIRNKNAESEELSVRK
ncbi:hypothetical protein GDO81_001877 [Engystomops pustulosus]|uniref:Ig-like domain-containing protein n=1 Tax=Engystomops pustulosus TaxID=76066 RepID=A0AAV7DFV3_ENGPU|nr:hypothetical protein GDO81_001877 [Engystomops pustulosus]